MSEENNCTTGKDHDVLIEIKANQKNMCVKIEKLTEKVDTLIEGDNKKVKWSTFWAIIVLFVGIMGAVIGTNFALDFKQADQITEIKSNLEVSKALLDRVCDK